ncbi:hypothetical protein Leryth_002446 [Lithospermum erythrorhizon]|uniref:DNA-binding transcription factor n=1 Tax=Lithospermum erythrorhizon TaxID=34254 RepID=A0AAV3PH38_LITER|nr:hypothetical protein Leryth_002446 [Lithospermum erythrorhizon]
MGRRPCCDKVGIKKGPWSAEEDNKLINFILTNGQCCWRAVPKLAGLLRCGKSCRLRWTNYLRPDLKRGLLSEYEENMVIDLHAKLGNKWSKIVSHLPGRTDNEIKNHWNTHIKKKLKKMGIDPSTHKPLLAATEPPQEPPQNPHQLEIDNKEIDDLSMQSPIMTDSKTNMMASNSSSFFEFDTSMMEQVNNNNNNNNSNNNNNNGFCIDEVPLIQSHEIQIQLKPARPPTSTTSAAFSPSCSSTSSTSFDNKNGTSTSLSNNKDMVDEGMQQDFQNFDWQLIEDYVNMSSLWDDDLINSDNSFLSIIDNNHISG